MNDDNSQSTIGEINSSLSLAAKRQHGLFKMISFLENCSTSQECSLLEQNCPFWIRTIFQILENHPVSLHAKLSHYAFYLIIQNSKSLSSDLQRHISTSLIEKAVHLIISSNDVLAKNSLLCLNELISCYKASCSQFKNKIENYIFNKLESESDEVIKWAGVCYAKLPYLHKNTNNNNNNNTTDMWYLYFKSMLQNVNTLLNDLFEDYNQQTTMEQQTTLNESLNETLNNKNESKTDIRQFTKLSKDSENLEFYYKKSLKRFKSCLYSLGSLLEPLNEKVVIKVRHLELINLLKRIYLFDFKKLSHNCRMNDESKYLSNCMSQILMSTFEFSEKFFTILNTNLIPNSSVINNMLVNCGHSLIDYISNNNGMSPLFTSYYSCLNTWMTSLGYNSGFHLNTFSIIENLLIKIKPVEKNILCIEKNDNNKAKNKQARGSASFGQEKYALNSQQILVQSKFIKSALECLRTYLRNFSFNLSYNQYEKIHSTIIDIILCVQYNCNIRRPYDHSETRQYLYETLFDLCFTKNTKLTPPISVSIGLFKNALNDNSKQIQLMSKNCLNFFKSFTYPLQPTYTKEFTIETNTKMEETTNSTSILMSNLALPITTNGPISVNKPTNSNIDESKPNEIDQFITKQQQQQNGYTLEEEDNYDVEKNSLSLNGQSNKRKIDYEDEDDDEEMNEDDQDEDEIEYKPKNIAKKFQSNGSYQSRIKVLNGRDVNENSNGDDDDDVDEEEEEEEEEEEDENEDEEVISLDEEVEDVENAEELEDDVEQNDEEDEHDDEEGEEVDEQTEEIEQEVVCEQIVIEHVQNQNELMAKVESQEDKTNSETNTELAHEAKSIIKETCGEYDDDDDDDGDEVEEDDVEEETQSKSIDSSKINENEDKNDNQEEISMANLETVRIEEVIENSVEQEILHKEEQHVEKVEEVVESNTELVVEENKPSESVETAGVDSEGFDEDKFKQMCSSLNVNAIAENNNNNN